MNYINYTNLKNVAKIAFVIMTICFSSCTHKNLQFGEFESTIDSISKVSDLKDGVFIIIDSNNSVKRYELGNYADLNIPDFFDFKNYSSHFLLNRFCNLIEHEKLSKYEKIVNICPELDEFYHKYIVYDLIAPYPEMDLKYRIGADSLNNILMNILGKRKINKLIKSKLDIKSIIEDQKRFKRSLKSHIADIQHIREPFKQYESSFAGLNIQHFYGSKIYWCMDETMTSNLMLLTIIPEKITLIAVTNVTDLSSPIKINENNVLFSTIARSFLQIYASHNAKAKEELNYYAFITSSETKPTASKSEEMIYKTKYSNEIPWKLAMKPRLADLSRYSGISTRTTKFKLKNDDSVRVIARGEGVKKENAFYYDWENDNVQIYFDCQNLKNEGFDIYNGQFQFLFINGINNICGNFISKKNIKYKFKNQSHIKYSLEAFFPWKTINYKPSLNSKIGCDIQITDNDGNKYEGAISWSSAPDETHRRTVNYKTLVLKDYHLNQSDSFQGNNHEVYVKKTSKTPFIDGNFDDLWSQFKNYQFKYSIKGNQLEDLEGSARICWDNNGIYFFIEVLDNYINKPWTINTLYDYGWIENVEGERIWQMSNLNTEINVKYPMLRDVDTLIFLPAGEYSLFYKSDNKNSYNDFYKSDFWTSLYGIKVFRNN